LSCGGDGGMVGHEDKLDDVYLCGLMDCRV
jgi:hypothetical protein